MDVARHEANDDGGRYAADQSGLVIIFTLAHIAGSVFQAV
jgi:hypothetical protein